MTKERNASLIKGIWTSFVKRNFFIELTSFYLKNKYSSDKILDIDNEYDHFDIHVRVQNHKSVQVLDDNRLKRR